MAAAGRRMPHQRRIPLCRSMAVAEEPKAEYCNQTETKGNTAALGIAQVDFQSQCSGLELLQVAVRVVSITFNTRNRLLRMLLLAPTAAHGLHRLAVFWTITG